MQIICYITQTDDVEIVLQSEVQLKPSQNAVDEKLLTNSFLKKIIAPSIFELQQ